MGPSNVYLFSGQLREIWFSVSDPAFMPMNLVARAPINNDWHQFVDTNVYSDLLYSTPTPNIVATSTSICPPTICGNCGSTYVTDSQTCLRCEQTAAYNASLITDGGTVTVEEEGDGAPESPDLLFGDEELER